MTENRPFQGYWRHFKDFDKKRSNHEIEGYLNTLLAFARDIGVSTFLAECRKIITVTEMAIYYGNRIETQAEFERLLNDISAITTHEWVIYFAIYYSSWTGSMVLEKDKVFSAYDQVIIQCTLDNVENSLQQTLLSIIKVIGYEQWKKHLKDLNINRNIGILKEKYVVGPEYILNLDIFEARHQLDNLVCYSGLKDTTFYDLQKGLSIKATLQTGIVAGAQNNLALYQPIQQS